MALTYWCALIALCWLSQTARSITVEELYPFGWLAGDTALPPNDDGASPPIHLQTNFPFFDVNRRTLYINNNGLLSFEGPVTSYSSQPFPIAASQFEPATKNIIIAPYWADVDTRTAGSGAVWYRQTANSTLLGRARQEVTEILRLFPDKDVQAFNPTLLVIATWDKVGYYNRNFEKTNTFQCVMVTDGSVSYIFFLYAEGEVQWTTGDGDGVDGLGGTPAQVGLNAGDPVRFQSIHFSQTDHVIDIDEKQGNTGRKGLWAFRVDSEVITNGTCTTDGSIALLKNQGSVLGGTAAVVIGPCFNSSEETFCDFRASIANESVQAVFLDSRRVLCISPALSMIGRTEFRLIGENFVSKAVDFYSLPFTSHHKVNIAADSLLVEPGSELILNWPPNDVTPPDSSSNTTVNIVLHLITSNGIEEMAMLATDVSNSGSVRITVPLLNATGFDPAIIQVALSNFHDINTPAPSVWSMVVYYGSLKPSRQLCIDWSYETDEREAETSAIDSLINCPCTELQAQAPNSGFKQQLNTYLSFQNAGANVCYYQSAIKSTSARQCCYNSGGELIIGPTSGGHSDFYSPLSTPSSPYTAMQQHVEKDIVPFIHCCKSPESLCIAFYEHRASADNTCKHVAQSSAFVYGDPHFLTFDRFKYTFNGKGDFVFIETRDNTFTMHGRMMEAATDGVLKPASVISGVVMKQQNSDSIQFETSRRVVDILINGIRINFNGLSELTANNAVVTKITNGTYTIQFSCGVYVKVDGSSGYLSPVIVSVPGELSHQTRGLLGSYNGDPLDDLLSREAVTPLPTESSLQAIHEGFGLSWTISSQSDSEFYYRQYDDFADFFDPTFPAEFDPVFFDVTSEMQAVSICNGDPFCIFDIAVTSSQELGLSTRMVGETVEFLSQFAIPIICDPPCQNGTCVANNTCNCQAGFQGDRCEGIVLQGGCETDVCENEGTCTHLAEDSICLCPPYAFGFNCEQLQDTGNIFEVNCTSELQDQNLQIACSANLPIERVQCSLNNNFMGLCTLPFSFLLSSLEVGNNTIVVMATSVFNDTVTSMITRIVEPLDLQCKGDAVSEHLIIDGCESRNELVSTTCSLNETPRGICDFPLDVDFTMMLPGMYTLQIAATDVYSNHDYYHLQYTKPPLDIRLVNSSPRVARDTVIADFILNRPIHTVPVQCHLAGQRKRDCSSGRVVFTNLEAGRYTLRIVAKASNGERDIERRRIFIGNSEDNHCAVHLINEGIQVQGKRVTVQFVATEAVASLSCRVDGGSYHRCRSPYRLFNVEPGRHRVQVRPQCSTQTTHNLSEQFTVEVQQ